MSPEAALVTVREWKRDAIARPGRLAVVLVCVAVLMRMLAIDQALPELTRGGRPFLLSGIPAGLTVSQTFATLDDRLTAVGIDAVVEGRGFLDASLIEVGPAGERRVRVASLPLEQAKTCCRIPVDPLENSGGRTYRLELRLRETGAPVRLGLRATAVRDAGGLVLNGRRQPVNLVMSAEGARLARLPGARRLNLAVLLGLFAAVDASMLLVVYLLLTASSPRRG